MTSDALALFCSLIVTAAVVAWASHILFQDYREGFRMLYHWTPADVSPSADVEPREPKRSIAIQIGFVGTALLIAVLGFAAFSRLLN